MFSRYCKHTRDWFKNATLLTCLVTIAFSGYAQSGNAEIANLTIGQQAFRVPIPKGFVETSQRSPELWATAQSLSAGDARIVAHFVPTNDFAKYEAGKEVQFKNFLLVQTPKRAEGIVATQAQFDKLRSGTVAMQSQLSSRLEPRIVADLDRISRSFSANQAADINVQLDQIVPVSIDNNLPRILMFTWLARVAVSEMKNTKSQTLVVTAAYCLINGKVLMLTAYRHFHTPSDLQDVRKQVDSWANALFATN